MRPAWRRCDAEIAPCTYAGAPTKLTPAWGHLARLKGPVVIAFADNEHLALISGIEHFRCFVRTLPPVVEGRPQYLEQAKQVPYPIRTG